MENTVTMPDLDPEVLELLRKNFSRRPEDKLTKPELEVRAQAITASAGLSCCRSDRGQDGRFARAATCVTQPLGGACSHVIVFSADMPVTA
jgi:hypothetical protein